MAIRVQDDVIVFNALVEWHVAAPSRQHAVHRAERLTMAVRPRLRFPLRDLGELRPRHHAASGVVIDGHPHIRGRSAKTDIRVQSAPNDLRLACF